MTKIIELGEIKVDKKLDIMIARFTGDYSNDDYKNLWFEGLYQAKSNNIKKVFIDQSKVGKVSFIVRSWFIMIMLPLIKKELGNNVALSVLPAEDEDNASRAKYFVKMANAMTPFKIATYPDEKLCIEYLKEFDF